MPVPISSDQDFAKGSRLLNVLLHEAATATINAALTVRSQLGYDSTILRAKIHDGTAVRTLLQNNDITTSNTMGGGSATDSTVPSTKSVYDFVINLVSSGQEAFTDFDATTNTTFPSGATLSKRYRVSVAGTVQGVVLQVADIFWPKVATPSTTNAADWVFAQGNVDAASSSSSGLVLLATYAQLTGNAGGDANRVVTVATFNQFEADNPRLKRQVLTNQSFSVGTTGLTHTLNTTNIASFNVRSAAGNHLLEWNPSTNSNINVTVSVAISNATVIITAV
jgi:hypothetical protein